MAYKYLSAGFSSPLLLKFSSFSFIHAGHVIMIDGKFNEITEKKQTSLYSEKTEIRNT